VLSSLHKRVACSLGGKERERDRERERGKERVSRRKAREGKRSEKEGDAGEPSWEQPSARRACQVAVYINFIADF